MKIKLALALVVLSANALAKNLRLGDLNFFQKKGSIYGITDLSKSSGDSNFQVSRSDGAGSSSKNEFESLIWSNRINYGITDRFNAGIGLNYAVNKVINKEITVNSIPAGKLKTFEDTGLSDLILNANYRALNGKFYVDGLSSLTLGLQERESGSSSGAGAEDGNFKQGHSSLRLGAAAGQKYAEWEWRTRLDLDYHFSGKRTSIRAGTSDVVYDTDGYLNVLANAQVQYRANKNFALTAVLDYIIPGDRELIGNVFSIKEKGTVKSDSIINYGLMAKYNLSDAILIKAGYTIVPGYDVESTTKSTLNSKAEEKDLNFQRLLVGAEFLF